MSSTKSNRSRKVALIASLTILALAIVAGILFLPFSPWRIWPPAAVSPQVQAMRALEAASTEPVEYYFQQGFPRFVRGRLQVEGEDLVEKARNFLTIYAPLYRLDNPDLALQVRRIAGLDSEEVIFYQTYRGVPVYASEIGVVFEGEDRYFTFGGLLTDISLDVNPLITEYEAEAAALTATGLPADTPFRAETRLEIYDPAILDDVPSEPHLTWRVFLFGTTAPDVFVDAHTGEILLIAPTTHGDHDLQLETANGNWGSWCYYDTTDDAIIGNEDGLYAGYLSDRDAVTAWWAIHDTYWTFANQYGLDSWDNDGDQIEAYIHAGGDVVSGCALYRGGCEIIEFSNTCVSADIAAHEFSHGSLDHIGLAYSGQSAAVQEGYADVMGALVDRNWEHGDGRPNNAPPNRNIATSAGIIDHLSAYSSSTDAHLGGGLISKPAYLVAQGGAHRGWIIDSIGMSKMGVLFYTTGRNLSASAGFMEFRNLAVAFAESWVRRGLYGFTTRDVCQVRNAFAAVGLGNGDSNCDGREETDPDRDRDGIPDSIDNCRDNPNPDQRDGDGDHLGDVCDPDHDNDGFWDAQDNCPLVANPDQRDSDHNGVGDACQDSDGDGIVDQVDNCLNVPNPDQTDTDSDGQGNACDSDDDNDGILDTNDNCRLVANRNQWDDDGDGVGSACDNCVTASNRDQRDTDADRIGDACDPDADNDGIPNEIDNCPYRRNPDQTDLDGNGIGTACDDDIRRTLVADMTKLVLWGSPGRSIRIPLPPPVCPDCLAPTWYPQNFCAALSLEGLDTRVNLLLTTDDGRAVSRGSRMNDSTVEMRYHPFGGVQYFLNLFFEPDFDFTQPLVTALSFNQADCGIPYPRQLAPPETTETFSGVVYLDADGDGDVSEVGDGPLAQAEVTVYGCTASTDLVTGPDGVFSLQVPAGSTNCQVRVSHSEYVFLRSDVGGNDMPFTVPVIQPVSIYMGQLPYEFKFGVGSEMAYIGDCAGLPNKFSVEGVVIERVNGLVVEQSLISGVALHFIMRGAGGTSKEYSVPMQRSGEAYLADMDFSEEAIDDLEQDLEELTANTSRREVIPGLQGWAMALDYWLVVTDTQGDSYSSPMLTQNVTFCAGPTAPPGVTPTFTPVMACSDYTNSNACGNAGCFWWWSNNTCHASPEPATPTLPPPTLVCSDYNGDGLACAKYGCYYWANMTCNPDPDPCHKYDSDQTGCESVGCSYDAKNNTCNTP